jgi:CBS domain-containing protein
MTVSDFMTENPACCFPDMNLQEAALLMREHDCGEIPVVDKETLRPVGVITDRDITCRAVAVGKHPLNVTVDECMTSPCVTVTPETSAEECISLLERHKIRRVPVVDAEGKCCGIVAQADIAKSADKEKTAELVKEVSQK